MCIVWSKKVYMHHWKGLVQFTPSKKKLWNGSVLRVHPFFLLVNALVYVDWHRPGHSLGEFHYFDDFFSANRTVPLFMSEGLQCDTITLVTDTSNHCNMHTWIARKYSNHHFVSAKTSRYLPTFRYCKTWWIWRVKILNLILWL